MRIGIGVGDLAGDVTGLGGVVDQVERASSAGFASAWWAQLFGWDALTTIAVVGSRVEGIALGTAVVPTYPRHPMMLAGQALTVQAAVGNRLTLGIGLSHQVVIEGMFGYSFEKPARHMREYLSALGPLLRGQSVAYQGETVKAVGTVAVPGAQARSVLVAALGPAMLRITGELADGTVTWMTGPTTIGDHIVPAITAAAAGAGRPEPRVVVGLPVCVTADDQAARERAASHLAIYGQLPSYRAMLDREGAAGPADVAVVGDEEAVTAQVARLADAGATEFLANPFGSAEERARTVELLAELARTVTMGAGETMGLDG